MNTFLFFIHSILFAGAFIMTADYYGEVNYDIPDWFEIFVYGGILGVSVLFTLGNIASGVLMGIAAGGMIEGLKMGGFVGFGLSIGRLWPYVLAFALSATFFAPFWHAVGGFIATVICLALNMSFKSMWANFNS